MPDKVYTPAVIKNCLIEKGNPFVIFDKFKSVSVVALDNRPTNIKVLTVKEDMNITPDTPWRVEIVS
jgi:hypothetical protein